MRWLPPKSGTMPRVEIDLILKGIKTIHFAATFLTEAIRVEIDLILKGIKTALALALRPCPCCVEIDLILKGIKTRKSGKAYSYSCVLRRNRPDSQRD